ncbi:MAG: bifunctional 3-(3-hydroxy-phenyl)propionate/3-hydroxycinnamic acid hydroxylase [Caulobacter sp.]|nr:bifunctional 3-(3-hydroxy-phenyl)propionate/3-hydroxycinnamic acid hydroxylase [Caulobacter sp.]
MSYDCDVLVVGLGPVGAALCALLAREGVTAIAVEKDSDVYPLPRAAHFDHEIMRLFQKLGIAEEMEAASQVARVYEFRNAAGQVLMSYDLIAQGSPSGWSPSYMFHQPSLEVALRRLATDSPLIDLRLRRTLKSIAQDADGVTATIDGPDGPQAIRARWLVGCDGAKSPVREALGIGMSDYGFDEPWLVIDAVVSDPSRLPTANLQICDPARPTSCLVMSQGRHRWEFMLLPGELPEDLLDDAMIRGLLKPWNSEDCVEIERKAIYRFHGRVANRWRDGRILLAGDAAHQTPPFAGQGMCSGLRDVDNLAWKLAAVIRRGADPALLDSYQTEREPHVRAVIELAIAMGRVVCISDPAAAAMRDAGMLAQREAGQAAPPPPSPRLGPGIVLDGPGGEYFPQPWAGDARMDDVLGAGPWLITRASLTDAPLAPFAEQLSPWFESRGAEAVLVRADRYVFGIGSVDTLEKAWAERVS